MGRVCSHYLLQSEFAIIDYSLLAAVSLLIGSFAACMIISQASSTFSSSYRLPTSCNEIGAST